MHKTTTVFPLHGMFKLEQAENTPFFDIPIFCNNVWDNLQYWATNSELLIQHFSICPSYVQGT